MAPPASPLARLADPLKQAIAREITGLFNDRTKGEAPVVRRADAMLGPSSIAWRVHGDVGAMMVGGVASLLMQMLHPAVLAGVWDHSGFRADMHGRLRRTARFIALTTFGDPQAAAQAIARVRTIHEGVRGTLPDGTPYAASDPAALAWVHVTETLSFLNAWRRYAEPAMPRADQDRYVAEMATIGRALGADPVPQSRAAAERLVAAYRPQLRSDTRAKEVARIVLSQRATRIAAEPAQRLLMQAAVDLLPRWARRLHGLHDPLPVRPLVRAGTFGLAGTLRWAFA